MARWQIAFVTGAVAAVALTAVVFGYGAVTALSAVVGVAVALINGLMARGDENITQSLLQRALNVGPFLVTVTSVLWLANAITVGWLALTLMDRLGRVDLTGTVTTSGEMLAKNAEVTLHIGGRELVDIAEDGTFVFANVERQGLADAVLMARWKDHKGEFLQVEFKVNGSSESLHLKLPPGTSPFKVSYFTAAGHAVDLLVRGELPPKWLAEQNSRVYVASTQVLSLARRWVNAYSIAPGEEWFDGEFKTSPDATDARTLSAGDIPKGLQKVFLGSLIPGRVEGELGAHFEESADAAKWLREFKPWLFANTFGTTALRLVGAEAFPAFSRGQTRRFLNELSGTKVPPDFGLLAAYYDECGIGYEFTFLPRVVEVRSLLIEALQDITLGDFVFRTSEQGFRSTSSVPGELDRTPQQTERLFERGLKRGETLVIPLEITFRIPENWSDFLDGRPINKPPSIGEITEQVLKVLGAAGDLPDKLESSYTFGPAVAVESITANGLTEEIRQFDPSRIFISSGYKGGSCPILSSRFSSEAPWHREGHLLYGVNDRSRERWDEMTIRSFDGHLLIEEHDPELSYIDALEVRREFADGSFETVRPLLNELLWDDQNYLRLRQGQHVVLQFSEHDVRRPAKRIVVRTKGFYQPVAGAGQTRTRLPAVRD